jgi:hypothetical protein
MPSGAQEANDSGAVGPTGLRPTLEQAMTVTITNREINVLVGAVMVAFIAAMIRCLVLLIRLLKEVIEERKK